VRLDHRDRGLDGLQQRLVGVAAAALGHGLRRRVALGGRGGGGRRAGAGAAPSVDAEVGEERLVEVVLALEVLLDDLQEAPDSAPWMIRWSYVEVIVMTFSAPIVCPIAARPGG
jgi:hypothetical protein